VQGMGARGPFRLGPVERTYLELSNELGRSTEGPNRLFYFFIVRLGITSFPIFSLKIIGPCKGSSRAGAAD
jgi:hypothetical protein